MNSNLNFEFWPIWYRPKPEPGRTRLNRTGSHQFGEPAPDAPDEMDQNAPVPGPASEMAYMWSRSDCTEARAISHPAPPPSVAPVFSSPHRHLPIGKAASPDLVLTFLPGSPPPPATDLTVSFLHLASSPRELVDPLPRGRQAHVQMPRGSSC